MREVVWRVKFITKRKNISAKFQAALAGRNLELDEATEAEIAPVKPLEDAQFEKIKERTMSKRYGRKEVSVNG